MKTYVCLSYDKTSTPTKTRCTLLARSQEVGKITPISAYVTKLSAMIFDLENSKMGMLDFENWT